MKTEAETGVMRPQAKGMLEDKSWKRQEAPPLDLSEGARL